MKIYSALQMYKQYLYIQLIIILISNTLIVKNYYYSNWYNWTLNDID